MESLLVEQKNETRGGGGGGGGGGGDRTIARREEEEEENMNGEGPKDEEQEVIEAGDSKTQDEINGEAEGDPVKNSIGFALLMKMGWKEGDGLGLHKQGRRDPIIVDAEEREPYAGLAHASEVNPFSKSNANKKAIHELESWEIGEFTSILVRSLKKSSYPLLTDC
eukprot:204202-Hanusia_phi.AAC.1